MRDSIAGRTCRQSRTAWSSALLVLIGTCSIHLVLSFDVRHVSFSRHIPIRCSSRQRLAAASPVASDAASTNGVGSTAPTIDLPLHKSMGAIGDWEEIHGNWILSPKIDNDEPPRALLHFLGGAIVGAAPHITYRYVLERLAENGYLIVATPYNLSFDHLETCDNIISRFERAAPTIARKYGALPVVGIGHSCGALLQLLITSLFPDTPRAANALLSFNNKPVNEAVPFFEELFAPLFTAIAAKNATVPSGSKVLALSLEIAKAATEGEIPSDEILKELSKTVLPPGLFPFDVDGIKIPQEIRQTIADIVSPPSTALADAGILPVMNQLFHGLEQIPLLIDEVADGARDFTPTPASVCSAARKAYRARRTLLIEYSDDPLDETGTIEELLNEARSVTRMKRPMVEVDLQRRKLEGGHASPLLAPPLDLAIRAEDILGSDAAKERLLYTHADATVEEISRWLEEGNL